MHSTHEPDESLLVEIGAGTLESLLRDHEVALWPEVESLARQDIRFRRALQYVWAYDSPPFQRRSALLEELGESRQISVRFIVDRGGFGEAENFSWRAVEVDGGADDDCLAGLLRGIADWLERKRSRDASES